MHKHHCAFCVCLCVYTYVHRCVCEWQSLHELVHWIFVKGDLQNQVKKRGGFVCQSECSGAFINLIKSKVYGVGIMYGEAALGSQAMKPSVVNDVCKGTTFSSCPRQCCKSCLAVIFETVLCYLIDQPTFSLCFPLQKWGPFCSLLCFLSGIEENIDREIFSLQFSTRVNS